jgi:hypothetical protein
VRCPRLYRRGPGASRCLFRQRLGEGICLPVGLLNRDFASTIIPQRRKKGTGFESPGYAEMKLLPTRSRELKTEKRSPLLQRPAE